MNTKFVQEYKGTITIIAIVVVLFLLFNFISMRNGTNDSSTDVPSSEVGTFDRSALSLSNEENPVVLFETSMGNIAFELYMDQAPITSANFLKLASEGFYTNTKFHRVIPDFMVQGGDPNTKGEDASIYGRGGPGYTIADEFIKGLSNLRGSISMANVGQPNSGGSQFFINVGNNIFLDFDKQPLESAHAVFGNVVDGMEVVEAITKVKTIEPGVRDLPVEPIVITNVTVYEADSEESPSTPDELEVI